MTLNIDLEDVPDAILEAVKARIMANRRRLLDREELLRQPPLQPKPQSRKFGADSKTWKRPQPAAVASGGSGWLLVPSGPWQSSLEGYQCITRGLPNLPFLTDQNDYEYHEEKLRPIIKQENGQDALISAGGYSTVGSQSVPGRLLQYATFEGLVNTSGTAPTASSGSYSSLGFWKWEYFYRLDRYDNGTLISSTIINEELTTTSPTSLRRPNPPSEHFSWGEIDGDPDRYVIRTLLSETKIVLVPPSTYPLYVNDNGNVSVSLMLTPASESELEPVMLTADTNLTVSSEPGFTNASATVSINGVADEINIGFSSRRIHYAFTIAPGTATGYIDGQRLLTTPIPNINPSSLYDVEITITADAKDDIHPFYPDPFLVGDTATDGSTKVADASRHSISGVRFTPGRALYRGSSFTPPSSITRLA